MPALLRRLDQPLLLLVLTVLFWSGNWVVGRGLRADVPPVALAFWRWVIAFACTLPFAWPCRAQAWPALREHWPILLILALLGITAYNTLAYLGLQYTTATNGVLLNSFIPVVILVLGWGFLGKPVHGRALLGLGASLLGVLVIVAHGEFARLLGLSFNPGDLWIMVSVFVWAAYTLLLTRRPAGLEPMLLLALLTAIGVLGLAPFYLWELAQGRSIHFSAGALAGMAYTGIFPAFLGYVFWNRAVAQVGAATAGLFIHLMPVATPLLSALFLGEAPRLYHLAGMSLIIGGIFISTRRA
ncbi:DMT family transporter [Uliginosibacterium sp. 31-12]|jgi:drug/metabolite transporter (DMT)-like permease|uniref:DMT family transporter n=1 Tax=Uliginosibacterium sp. 31-12 TaxID=3062781 RepID=UPI0026E26DB0|nr:DMT family transporter [Uliginosibacterium sp. 31-12]MDO6386774.1 DMT family transporter [Uliginosibacterium sp. 31-12]